MFLFSQHDREGKQGFTLVELLVAVGISIMITSLVLANYNRYRSVATLSNLAYSIALGVREAQVYGLSFKRDATTAASYGVHFSSVAGQNASFFVFEDVDNNFTYEAGPDLAVDTFTLNQNYSISSLCGYASIGSPCTALQSLDIAFTRPNPDAVITGFTGSGNAQYSYAEVTVTMPLTNRSRIVQVWNSGQISVKP